MLPNTKFKIILINLLLILAISLITSYNFRDNSIFTDKKLEYNDTVALKSSGHLTANDILIDDTLVGSNDWDFINSSNDWCNGAGTWSKPYIIENVTFNGSVSGYGLRIYNSVNYFIISNCTFTGGGQAGAYIFNTDKYFIIRNCTSSGDFSFGLYLTLTTNGSIIENDCSSKNSAALLLMSSHNNTILRNNFTNSNLEAIKLDNSNNNTISRNNVSNGDLFGIMLTSSHNNTISRNNATNNGQCGIRLGSSNNNTISGNNATNNFVYGIYLDHCHNNNITKNTVKNHTHYGIWLGSSNNNTISRNNVTNNGECGIWLGHSNNNTISKNNVTNNGLHEIWPGTIFGGIYLQYGIDNTISRNNVANSDLSGILLASSNNTLVLENNASYHHYGIWLGSSHNNTISKNNATNNEQYGIWLGSSHNNTLSGNNATNNILGGIYLDYCHNNTLSGNNASYNEYGIFINWGNFNNATGNTVNNNSYGIEISYGNNNTILGNTVNNNTLGIWVYYTSYNNVSDNTLLFNVWSIVKEGDCEGNIFENNERYTTIKKVDPHDFEIPPYGTDDFKVSLSFTLNGDTELLTESLNILPFNITTPLDDSLLFIEIALNDTDNLVDGNLEIIVNSTYALENVKGWRFDESANGGGAWQEVTISIEGNITTFSVSYTSIYGLTGTELQEEPTPTPTPTPKPKPTPAQQPPEDFALGHTASDPDTDGKFTLGWTESTGADNYSIYYYEDYITEINVSVPAVAHGITYLSYTIRGLTNGTYYFVVVAFNEAGNTLSNCVEVQVEIPPEEEDGEIEPPPAIPSGAFFLIFTIFGIIYLIVLNRKKIII